MAQFSKGGRQASAPAVPVTRGFEIVVPKCKVCASPHRREIDAALALGMSQASVRVYFNLAYGSDFFSPSNISNHARKHMTMRDAAVARIYEEAARREGIDTGVVEGFIRTKRGALENVVNEALTLMQAGTITPEVRDMIQAVQILDKMDEEGGPVNVAVLEGQFRAFLTAVQEIVPDDQWGLISKRYKELAGVQPELEAPKEREGEGVVDDG